MRTRVGYIRAILTLSGFFLLFSSSAQALSTSCGSPTWIVPDGRVTEYTIPASTTVWFAFVPTAGHSYTAEGNYPEDSFNPGVLAFKASDLNFATCAGTSTLGAIDTFGVDPDAEGGDRASFIVPFSPVSPPVVYMSAQNIEAVPHRFTFLVSETTLFNPLWSTFGGFQTFYRFQNTTSATIHVTLTLINNAGTTVATITALAIAPGATAATRSTSPLDLNVTPQQAGQGIITHDGPPGALQVDGFLGNFSGGSVVLPIKIVGARTRL